MWPNNLGAVFYNGLRGLLYYSGMAARVFVGNGGIVAVVAVGARYFPAATVAGLAGAVVIRGATWLTKKIDAKYNVHIADVVDKLLDVAPRRVTRAYAAAATTLKKPSVMAARARQTTPGMFLLNESLATELIAPILEESIYRLGIQEGLARGLMLVRVPPGVAHVLAGLIAEPLFAAGHNLDPRHPEYRETLIAGIGFGLMMYMYGLPGAVVAHAANNAYIRLENQLQNGLGRLRNALGFP